MACYVSPLFREVKSIWKAESVDQVARTANTNPDFATLLPAVIAAANAGDEVARKVLTQAGQELADLAAIVIRSLFPEKDLCDRAAIPLAVVGGVFRYALMVREIFCDTLRQLDPRVESTSM